MKNRNENTRQKYTSYKNILTNTLRLAKKKYFAEQLNQFRNDIKNTWKVINSVLNRAKNRSSIAKLRVDDIIIEDNKKIAENFNLYFSQIGSNLAKTITQGGKTFHDFLTAPNDHSIYLVPTNSEELLKIVRKIENK